MRFQPRSSVRTVGLLVLLTAVLTAGAPSVIRVKRGDTLSGLAARYGTTVSALQKANHLKGDTIYAGELLRAEVGGRWRLEPTPGLQPLWFAAGPNADTAKATKANLLGKVRKALMHGRGDSVASMVSAMLSIVREQS